MLVYVLEKAGEQRWWGRGGGLSQQPVKGRVRVVPLTMRSFVGAKFFFGSSHATCFVSVFAYLRLTFSCAFNKTRAIVGANLGIN